MQRRSSASLALVAFALLASACGAKPAATNNAPAANANAAKPAATATNTSNTSNTSNTNTSAATPADSQLSNLTIFNKTEWAVHHLYLAPTKSNDWGRDQLGTNTIEPGSSFKLSDIPCNTYDIKVVDEEGDECVISGEKFCGHEATWNLTQQALLNCEGYGE